MVRFSYFRWLLMVWGCCLLLGCAGSLKVAQPQAYITPTTQVTLPLPLGNIAHIQEQSQLLTAQAQGETHRVLMILSIENQTIQLVGLTDTAIKLFTLVFNANGMEVERHIPLEIGPAPVQVLADILFSYGDIDEWRRHLPTGWNLQDIGTMRILTDASKQTILDIQYDSEKRDRPLFLQHHVFDYHIAIQVLE